MKFGAILLATCLLSAASLAQNNPSKRAGGSDSRPLSSLQLTSTAKVPLVGTLVGKGRCDGEGNIYVRFMDFELNKIRHGITKAPIEKINASGTVAATFRVTEASPDISGKDFFVSADGEVYQAAFESDGESVYVLEFASSGSLKAKIRLASTNFLPYQIVVFRSGEFMLSGTTGLSNDHHPFTGVFDPQGKLIKEIYEPEDEDSRRRAEAGELDFVPDGTKAGNAFVWHGDVTLGSDGNAYLLRAASPALIYVISPKGDVIRKMRIDAPEAEMIAQGIKSAGGKLAISFLNRGMFTGMFKVVDLEGATVALFSSENERAPGLPGCLLSDGFVVLDDDDGRNLYRHWFQLK